MSCKSQHSACFLAFVESAPPNGDPLALVKPFSSTCTAYHTTSIPSLTTDVSTSVCSLIGWFSWGFHLVHACCLWNACGYSSRPHVWYPALRGSGLYEFEHNRHCVCPCKCQFCPMTTCPALYKLGSPSSSTGGATTNTDNANATTKYCLCHADQCQCQCHNTLTTNGNSKS